jgi:hypothetical protein
MLSKAKTRDPSIFSSTLDDLLAYNDRDFVIRSYQMLLGRDPDTEKLNYHLGRLRAGYSKTGILMQLSLPSKEAKARAAAIPGLKQAIRLYRWEQLPLLGRLIRAFTNVECDSPEARSQRRIQHEFFSLTDPLPVQPLPEDIERLSPRARDIYCQLVQAFRNRTSA